MYIYVKGGKYIKKYLYIISFLIILIGILFFINSNQVSSETNEITEKKSNKINSQDFFIDIKGYVKNPGVYKVKSNNIVNDAINMAGGLLKNATTLNINLSKKLEKEMVIIIKSKNELKEELNENHTCNTNDVDYTNCLKTNKNVSIISSNSSSKVSNNTNSTNDKININTANLDELMTLKSIGSSKAQAILDYRASYGNFANIDDIKNVTGIGDLLFAKIKDNITV